MKAISGHLKELSVSFDEICKKMPTRYEQIGGLLGHSRMLKNE
jgi:hypothetical protein